MKNLTIVIFVLISYLGVAQAPSKTQFKSSQFSTFSEIGISKEAFINQFGPPNAKNMYLDSSKSKVEVLQYYEYLERNKPFISSDDFACVLLITRFTFKDGVLIEQMSELKITPFESSAINKMDRIRRSAS